MLVSRKLNCWLITLLAIILLIQPTYADIRTPNKENLPRPILQEHPGWVELYYRAFEIGFSKVQQGTEANGFVPFYMDEAFSGNIFQWDTSFMMMFAKYANGELPSVVSLENFYMKQEEDGYICREISEADGSNYWPNDGSDDSNCSINPPLFSWAEWQDYLITGDSSRFSKDINGKAVLERLVNYYFWIKENRRWNNEIYWTTPFANGMDDSPRLNPKGIEGWDEEDNSVVCSNRESNWVDITAQQALNAICIANIAKETGDMQLYETFIKEHAAIKQILNTTMWDKEDGFYYDLNPDMSFHKVKTPASFWTMVAQVTSPEQTDRLVNEHILNPDEFWLTHHIPTVAKNEPLFVQDGGYWGGAVWAPTTYETIKGLETQGKHDIAFETAYNHIQNLYWVYKETNTLWENYQPSLAKRGSNSRADFVGWTGCGPIAALIENILGIQVNAPTNSITWRISLTEEHGIENLNFGDNTVSLLSSDRSSSQQGTKITIQAKKDFKLNIILNGETLSQNIIAGETSFEIGDIESNFQTIDLVTPSTEAIAFGSVESPQMFQPFLASSKNLKAVDINIRRYGDVNSHSNLQVQLYTIKNGLPKKLLGTASLKAKNIDSFFEVVNIPLAYDKLKIGQTYAIVLSQMQPQIDAYEWVIGEIDGAKNFGTYQNGWKAEKAKSAWLKLYVD
ncbi:MAG: trehalase family glycosidase [Reichenbachiella sp.]